MNELGWGSGVRLFVSSLVRVVAFPDLRAWFWRALKKCFFLAVLLLVGVLLGGAALIAHLGQGWWSNVAAILWVLVVLFISGTLTVSLMGALSASSVDERGLLSALRGIKVVGLRPALWSDRRGEWFRTLRGVVLSLVAWPLLLIPFLMPVGVLIFAWSMGSESLATARRLCRQNGEDIPAFLENPRWNFALGVGLGPALFTLVPIIGWAAWPLLILTSVSASDLALQRRL
ncbi:MAG: hypothetical protein JST16_07285 [Bdellovibrionales bacterium]|nr:hypothetical protein [Bdellovibrionales bacterium]